jgi:hypothetical protein
LSAWEDFTFEPRELTVIGDGALVHIVLVARGKGSGVEVTRSLFHGWTFRDGRPQRLFVCLTRDEALEAAGLSE